MAKPIFIIHFPFAVPHEESLKISEQLTQKLDDYHVLGYRDTTAEAVAFTVLNPVDVNEADLKQIVSEILEQIKSKKND
jgi:hypothetical protein